MLLFLVEWIAIFFYWTWPIWPPVFIISLVGTIAHAVREEVAQQMGQEIPADSKSPIAWAVVSFTIILCGLLYPALVS